MTSSGLSCAWCGSAFEQPAARGPAPLYCRRACRQRAYEHRRATAAAAALPPAEAFDALATAAARAVDGETSAGIDVLRERLDTLITAADRVLVGAGRTPVAATRRDSTPTGARPRTTPAPTPVPQPAPGDAAWDTAPPGSVIYRRRRADDGRWAVERWDQTTDGWLSGPVDPRSASPYPWTTAGRRSLIRALLSDVLELAHHGATLPVRGADGLLDQLAGELLPTDDTGFDLDRDGIEQAVTARWGKLADWLSIDEHGRHHQWRLVETRHDDNGTPTFTPSSRSYDTLHDAKRALRRLRAELTRDYPERKARDDRIELEQLTGAGRRIATPPGRPRR